MSETSDPKSEMLLYQTEDGRVRIDVRFEGETAWLTQASIARLYQTTPQNITIHVAAVYEEGELSEAATCKDYLQVREEVIGALGADSSTTAFPSQEMGCPGLHWPSQSCPRGS